MPAYRSVFADRYFDVLISLGGAVLITLFTFPVLDFQTFSGLDPAYFHALNYFFRQGWIAGKDYIFSYGPLGFLKDPQALVGLATPGVIVITLLRFLTAWTLLNVGKRENFSLGLNFAVVFFAMARLQGLDYVMFLLGAGLALLHNTRTNRIYFFSAWGVAAAGALIKLNIGFSIAAFLCIFYALKSSLRKKIVRLASGAGIFLMVYMLLWLFVYDTWEGSFLYLWYSLKLAPDNLAATVLPTTTDQEALIASAVLFSLGCLWLYLKQGEAQALAAWGAFFLVFRYSVARSDFFHLVHGFNMMVAGAALMVLSCPVRPLPVAAWGLALMLWRTAAHGLDYVPDPIRIPQPQLSGFKQSLWNHSKTVQDALKKNSVNLEADTLPRSWLHIIGGEAVDFFPWVTSAVARHALNYHPRPFMQHGLGAHPFFDELTARYLCSGKAAPYLIWHGGWSGQGVETMDGRYVGSEHTRTFQVLLCCYELLDASLPNGILLRRKKETEAYIPSQERFGSSFIQEKPLSWNTWISIPAARADTFVWGRITGRLSLRALLRRWFWKESVYYVDLRDSAGRVYSHRLALRGAQDRMMLNPYFPTFPLLSQPIRIRAVRFRVTEGPPLLIHPLILQLWQAPFCPSPKSD
jgi:hypothetical protein